MKLKMRKQKHYFASIIIVMIATSLACMHIACIARAQNASLDIKFVIFFYLCATIMACALS